MLNKYRVIVQYEFRKGMESKGIEYLETHLLSKAKELGCHYIELWHNEKYPNRVDGIAVWADLQDAKNFQKKWEAAEEELVSRYCTKEPTREFSKLVGCYSPKNQKAA